jgi:hypothetical protein
MWKPALRARAHCSDRSAGPRLSIEYSKIQALLDQLLGVQISRAALATIRQRITAALEQLIQEALAFARQQLVEQRQRGQ